MRARRRASAMMPERSARHAFNFDERFQKYVGLAFCFKFDEAFAFKFEDKNLIGRFREINITSLAALG